ncbi:MAG: regulatory protein GntR [Mycobacterium sp.]|jgi:GntR family transcriptional repressor for pyruvate dehydrogenase complex|nr:regulatory protein GntR [Mycobacterium sp.]
MTDVLPVGQLLRAPKTAELIATHLRRQIVRGELKPGDTLPPEVGLMGQFGVSRPTLREAFRILETEALITVRRGSRGGARVTAPDNAVAARYVGLLLQVQGTTFGDVYEARSVLEPACARMLAERRTEDHLLRLRACVEELRSVVEAGPDQAHDPVLWGKLTTRFHEVVLQGSGNRTLALQGAVLQEIVDRHLALSVSRHFDENPALIKNFQRTIRSYRKLISLVEARNGAGAERHWRNHMDVAASHLLRDELAQQRVVDLFT